MSAPQLPPLQSFLLLPHTAVTDCLEWHYSLFQLSLLFPPCLPVVWDWPFLSKLFSSNIIIFMLLKVNLYYNIIFIVVQCISYR